MENDIAAEAVATIQRALRSLLHLHPRQINDRRNLAGTRLVNVVHINTESRIGVGRDDFGIGTTHRRPQIRSGAPHAHAGNELLQPIHSGDVGVLDLSASYRRNRQWHLLQGLRAALSGDGDDVHRVNCPGAFRGILRLDFRGILRLDNARSGKQADWDGGQQKRTKLIGTGRLDHY